jgi:hypothetical protein
MADEAFFAALKKYVGQVHAYSTATTDDLQAVLEDEYGESLQWFFDQWVYGEGYPNYQFEYAILAQRDSSRIKLDLSDQPSHHSVSHFTMPVPVQFAYQNTDGEVLRDTTIRLWHTEQTQEWTLNLPFIPNKVHFDPKGDLLRGFTEITKLESSVWGGNRPQKIKLLNNYPNPFNPKTTIPFQLPQESHIRIDVYNLYGRHIATLFEGYKAAGEHVIEWDAYQQASGIYFVRLSDGRQNYTKKITLLK